MAMAGIDLIRAERVRQIHTEGHTTARDIGRANQLALAGAIYAYDAWSALEYGMSGDMPEDWPWDEQSFRPDTDPTRTLIKAAALIASAIDALGETNA